jgi:hypothetical protein
MERINSVDGIVRLLKDKNITIHRTDLCGQCRAISRKWADGYLVLVEETLCFPATLAALKHELAHILLGHFDDNAKTRDQKEAEVLQKLRN